MSSGEGVVKPEPHVTRLEYSPVGVLAVLQEGLSHLLAYEGFVSHGAVAVSEECYVGGGPEAQVNIC